MRHHFLHKVFEPQSVAIVGASDRERSVGYRLLRNMLDAGYQGALYPVNAARSSVQGLPAFASVRALSETPDLVVIAVPAGDVPQVIHDCGARQVYAVMIISAGFGEVGELGESLQAEIVRLTRQYNIRLVGPNCLGLIRPRIGLNASFSNSKVAEGQVALVAQSGAFCTALLDWAGANGFGFSAVASLGAGAEVGFGEVLDYLAIDDATRSILLYVEGVDDARAFISGLRSAARMKPVVIIKVGRSHAAQRLGVAHSASCLGGDEAFDAAISRAGAVRVQTVTQLFSAARTLASGTRVAGGRLAVITNGAGPGLMAADRAADLGVNLAQLSEQTYDSLASLLPEHWSQCDPVDLLGDADGDRYAQATKIILADKQVDAALVLLAPQGMTKPTECATALGQVAADIRKPVIACWMGEERVDPGRRELTAAGIPHFTSPEAGVDAFAYLAAYHRHQNALMQVPAPLSAHRAPDTVAAHQLIAQALAEGRSGLAKAEAEALAAAFHIPVADPGDMRGEKVDEIKISILRDPAFGPVIRVGAGGTMAELLPGSKVTLPPLNVYLCKDLIGRSPGERSSRGFRFSLEAELPGLVDLLMRVSEMACELPEIQELVIDPVLVSDSGVLPLAASIVLLPVPESTHYRHMAIHPYPAALTTELTARDGREILVRAIRPEDAKIEQEAVDGLSPESRYFRFMYQMGKITPWMLSRFTQIDYDRELALIAVVNDNTPEAQMAAVVRYVTNPDGRSCEFALTVMDEWQSQGLGPQMMELLMTAARERGLEVMEGDVLSENRKMLRLCQKLGFTKKRSPEDASVIIVQRQL